MALKSAIASRKLNTQFQLRLNRQVLNPSSKIPQNKKSPSSVSKQKKKEHKTYCLKISYLIQFFLHICSDHTK